MSAFVAWLVAFAVLCLLGLIVAAVLPERRAPAVVAWFGAFAALAAIGLGVVALFTPVGTTTLWTIPAIGAVVLRSDSLSGLFAIVTGLVALPASVFTASALPRVRERYRVRPYAWMLFVLLLAIIWLLFAGDVFSFLVAWEIMSVLCYLLVVFEHEDAAHRRAGYLMLAMSEAGALAAALGLLLLAGHAGTVDFTGIEATSATLGSGTREMVFLLTFFGFGVKAGLVPVNAWLPRAYTAAPAPFVPLFAGATLNLGIYGIVRVNADLAPATSVTPGLIALIVGTLSAIVGILYATTDNDLKTLLAHSSIENAGIMMTGFASGLLFAAAGKPALAAMGYLVGFYHLLNHSLYKTLLFVGAGAVDDRAGTRNLDRLGGLVRLMPWTAAAMLVGVVSIAAMPPFNGFVSEWLTLQTVLRSVELSSVGVRIVFALCGAGLALTAALAVTCFAKFYAMGFLGLTRSTEAEQATETGATALGPMAFLAVLCLLLGILPTYAIGALDHVVQPLAHASAATALVPPFFDGSPGHDALPADFVHDFHDLGAQLGQHVVPGPGLVLLHRGGTTNPVVFAAAPALFFVVIGGLLLLALLVVRGGVARHRVRTRRIAWDGGLRRLLPEMTYTATGFSNPVRVIFQAIFRPTIVEDTRESVAEHFRTAIRRESDSVHIVDRLVLHPIGEATMAVARFLARLHHGRLNAYLAYALLSLLIVLIVFTVP